MKRSLLLVAGCALLVLAGCRSSVPYEETTTTWSGPAVNVPAGADYPTEKGAGAANLTGRGGQQSGPYRTNAPAFTPDSNRY